VIVISGTATAIQTVIAPGGHPSERLNTLEHGQDLPSSPNRVRVSVPSRQPSGPDVGLIGVLDRSRRESDLVHGWRKHSQRGQEAAGHDQVWVIHLKADGSSTANYQ